MKIVDEFLNSTTMYRLMEYYLLFVLGCAVVFSYLGILAFNPLAVIFSIIFLIVISYLTNLAFSRVFDVPANVESVYITALILALIITPPTGLHGLPVLFWAAILASSGKFILAWKKKHVFNPAALAVFLTAVFLGQSASWWVGSGPMFAPVLLGGLLIVRKIRRWDLVGPFVITAIGTILLFDLWQGISWETGMPKILLETPLLFFAFVMLTEPMTSPPRKILRIGYGAIVGFLFAPQIHLGSIYSTPELALLTGNIFSYVVSPKERLTLILTQKKRIAPDTYDFIFSKKGQFKFIPGQYLEWTLKHLGVDSRGNRRYFTLASSPGEENVRIGVKFYERSSSFKNALMSMKTGDRLAAGQMAGDFIMPKDSHQKLVFVAGGIGITPFRSMLSHLLEIVEKRDVVVLYSNRNKEEIVYQDVLDKSKEKLGTRVVFFLTDEARVPPNWQGRIGRIDENAIAEEIPDYKERVFYLSGPHSMVDAYETVLKKMGISINRIVVDYFPGYA